MKIRVLLHNSVCLLTLLNDTFLCIVWAIKRLQDYFAFERNIFKFCTSALFYLRVNRSSRIETVKSPSTKCHVINWTYHQQSLLIWAFSKELAIAGSRDFLQSICNLAKSNWHTYIKFILSTRKQLLHYKVVLQMLLCR